MSNEEPLNTPAETAPATTPPSMPPRRRWRWRWLWLLLLIPIMLIALLVWATASETGFAWTIRQISQYSGTFSAQQVQGTLWRGFSLKKIHIDIPSSDIELDSFQLVWQSNELWSGRLHINHLALGNLKLTPRATPPSPPSPMPESLSLPLNVQLDKLSIQSLSLGQGKAVLYQSSLSYRYENGQHRLVLNQLLSPWAQAKGAASIADARPFKLDGKFNLQLQLADTDIQGSGDLQLGGDLTNTSANLQYVGKHMTIDLDSQIDPFAYETLKKLKKLDLRAGGFNPHSLDPSLPRGEFNLALQATPVDADTLHGGLTLINATPGTISEGAIPLKLLYGELRIRDGQLDSPNLQAQMLNGNLTLSGNASSQRLALKAQLDKILLTDLGVPLGQQTLSGNIATSGTLSEPGINLNVFTEVLSATGNIALGKRAKEGQPLTVSDLKLSARDGGAAKVNAKLVLGNEQQIDARAELMNANPQQFWPGAPAGKLNGLLTAKGVIAKAASMQIDLTINNSQLSGEPLSGSAHGKLDGERISALNADLRLANNRLIASGAWGNPGDRLKAQINAPNLAPLGMGFGGAINGQIDLSGTMKSPALDANLKADKLTLPGGVGISHAELTGKAGTDARAPLNITLRAQGVTASAVEVSRIDFDINGTRASHRINSQASFTLSKQPFQFNFAATGGLVGEQIDWRGQISRLELSGTSGIRLLNPLTIQASAQHVNLSAARFTLLGGSLDLDAMRWQKGSSLVSKGRANNIALAALSTWVPTLAGQDMVLAADWDVSLGGTARGRVNLQRQSGDFQIPLQDGRKVAAGLSTLQAQIQLAGGRSDFKINVVSRFARLESQGSFNHGSAIPDLRTPINATLKADIESLAVLKPFLPVGLDLSGKLNANLGLQGSLTARRWSGTIVGSGLGLYDRPTGVKLENGTLSVNMEGQRLILNQLRFVSQRGERTGEVTASGVMEGGSDVPTITAKVNFNRFSVFSKPGRRLVVSGSSELGVSALKGIVLAGKLHVDFGRIDLPKSGAPTLSDDVIVVGETPPEPSALSKLPITVEMELDLGDKFRFSGEGLNVDLGGILKISASPGLPPSAVGQVNITQGRYKAYGQDLEITKGTITFNGPLENPTLNIRAVRRMSPVGAGVEVTGSVSQPRVRLVADEPMSDKEKLAWLVLGRSAGGSQDDAALAAAAGAFLAGSINDRIGLFDDLGIASKKERTSAGGQVSPAEQVVTVGKQLTKEIYIGYEYGITSADSAVKLVYQLTKAWSLVLRAGQDSSSAETRFTYRFD